jgi:O-antigen/teichoic acid export membrane protein
MIARYLDPNKFGKYAFILVAIAVLRFLAHMGIPVIVTREVARDKDKAPVLLASALKLQAMCSLTVLAVVSLTAYSMGSTEEMVYAAILCGAAMVMAVFGELFAGIFQAFEKMKFHTFQTMLSETLYVVLVFVVTQGPLGIVGVFWALFVAKFVGALFGFVLVVKRFVPLRSENTGLERYFARECYPLAIKRILGGLNIRSTTLLLKAFQTNFDVGIFHGAYRIILNVVSVANSVSFAIFPILSRLSASSESSLQLVYEKSFKFTLLVGVPVAVILSSFAEPIVTIVLGHKYLETVPVLQILGAVFLLVFVRTFIMKMLVAGGRQGLTTVVTGISLTTNVILALILIPKMSYMGAAYSTLISQLVAVSLAFCCVSKYLDLHVAPLVVLKPLCAGAATYLALFLLHDINAVLGGGMGMAVYAGSLLMLGTFTADEIGLCRKLLRRTSA